MTKKILTISDIARLSGVAKSTVSRVINNSGFVSPETKARVNEVIAQYNYVPNAHAKSLSQAQTNTIAVFIGDMSNQYFSELFKGIESEIIPSKYFPIICICTNQERLELYLDEMLRRRVRGAIFASSDVFNRIKMDAFVEQIPCVSIQTYLDDVPIIGVDDFNGGYEMGKYLLSMGHRKFGYINGRYFKSLEDRYQGFIKALNEAGISEDEVHVKYTDREYRGRKAAEELLKEDITCIQCCNDNIVLDAIKVIRDHGKNFPDDISVSGYDDLPNDTLFTPGITSVKQPLKDMGKLAAGMLLSMIEHNFVPEKEYTLKTQLVIRGSVKAINRK